MLKEVCLKLIKQFIILNRAASFWCSKAFPNLFGRPQPDRNVVLLDKIYADIENLSPSVVLEAGGVDRPILEKNPAYNFIGIDIEDRPACHDIYDNFILQSIEQALPIKVDLILSKTLLEHVPDNSASIKAMYDSLNSGGTTHHYVPSGNHPYSMILRIIGPKLQKRIIPIVRPGAESTTGYPAFFHICYPRSMVAEFEKVGFSNVQLKLFYRANDYFAFFLPAYILVSLFEKICEIFDISIFCSGFVISAIKPSD